jgi:hypothetical protein
MIVEGKKKSGGVSILIWILIIVMVAGLVLIVGPVIWGERGIFFDP